MTTVITLSPNARLRGYALRIKTALHNNDRNALLLLDDQLLFSSPFECDLEELSKSLVANKMLTRSERSRALQFIEPIHNAHYSERKAPQFIRRRCRR